MNKQTDSAKSRKYLDYNGIGNSKDKLAIFPSTLRRRFCPIKTLFIVAMQKVIILFRRKPCKKIIAVKSILIAL